MTLIPDSDIPEVINGEMRVNMNKKKSLTPEEKTDKDKKIHTLRVIREENSRREK